MCQGFRLAWANGSYTWCFPCKKPLALHTWIGVNFEVLTGAVILTLTSGFLQSLLDIINPVCAGDTTISSAAAASTHWRHKASATRAGQRLTEPEPDVIAGGAPCHHGGMRIGPRAQRSKLGGPTVHATARSVGRGEHGGSSVSKAAGSARGVASMRKGPIHCTRAWRRAWRCVWRRAWR